MQSARIRTHLVDRADAEPGIGQDATKDDGSRYQSLLTADQLAKWENTRETKEIPAHWIVNDETIESQYRSRTRRDQGIELEGLAAASLLSDQDEEREPGL